MPATSLNHVSVSAANLEESVSFYEELFGMRPVPTPNFGFPVRWLRVGPLQLHIFERPEEAPRYHHVAVTVDDFEDVYRRAKERGLFDAVTFGHHFYELPGNIAQLYLRDPAGNMVEVDAPNARSLAADILVDIKRLADKNPQSEENLRATLFLED